VRQVEEVTRTPVPTVSGLPGAGTGADAVSAAGTLSVWLVLIGVATIGIWAVFVRVRLR
jgi:hypothetical protein